jgi:hypothetical protein
MFDNRSKYGQCRAIVDQNSYQFDNRSKYGQNAGPQWIKIPISCQAHFELLTLCTLSPLNELDSLHFIRLDQRLCRSFR